MLSASFISRAVPTGVGDRVGSGCGAALDAVLPNLPNHPSWNRASLRDVAWSARYCCAASRTDELR
jgi:hypothetical protein